MFYKIDRNGEFVYTAVTEFRVKTRNSYQSTLELTLQNGAVVIYAIPTVELDKLTQHWTKDGVVINN